MRISMIVAVATNGVIGKDGDMPWHVPSDLKHFKQTTTGHAVVMGRKTYESIIAKTGGKPLPNRLNIILSRQADYAPPSVSKDVVEDVAVVETPQAAMDYAAAQGHDELFVIGGGEIYTLFEPMAVRIIKTEIHAAPEGDVHFTLAAPNDWQETDRKSKTNPDVDFVTLERVT